MSKDVKVYSIKLATNQMPEYKADHSKGIIKDGKKNDYSNYLLFLLNNHSEHGAIVRGKAKYLSGLSISPVNEDDNDAKLFLSKANDSESWYDLTIKTDLDDCTFGGHYLKVTTNLEGVPVKWEHLNYNSVRVSDSLESYKVCDDWSSYAKTLESKTYPKYKQGYVGESIHYVKKYMPTVNKLQSVYAKPEYLQCTLDIDTDIRVGSFFNNYVKNNFSAGTMITIFNGETDPVKQENIVDRLKLEYTGEDEGGKVMVVFAPENAKGSEVLSLNSNDLDKQYVEITKRNKEKIISGHGVPAQLFKVKVDDRALFSRSELIEAHELFINEYVKYNQTTKLNNISKWYKIATGKTSEFKIEQINNIGLELPLDNQNIINALNTKDPNLVVDYIIEKYGIKLPETASQLPNTPQQVQQETNDALRGLSAKDNMDLIRIVRDYDKGRLNEHLAMARIKAYGINDEQAKKILGIEDIQVQQSDDKNKLFFSLMDKYAKDVTDDEVLERVQYSGHKTNFATALEVSVTELRNAILNQIKGNPFLSVYDLAKNFNVAEDKIQEQLNWLSDKKLIDTSGGSFTPTEKAIGTETEPVETEIYTEYTYGLRDDLPSTSATGESNSKLIISTTRDFCRNMVTKYAKKSVDYSVIENLNNEFGDSAFEYRGGYYNDGDKTTPWCRHVWVMETKLRRKK